MNIDEIPSDQNKLAAGIADTIGSLVTNVPAPIRKNAWKAFGRLCTAATEYPAAVLEGLVAEKRAETEARVKIINATGAQIVNQLKVDPAYSVAATSKFAQKIVRERMNVDRIAAIASSELTSTPFPPAPDNAPEDISDDWLNAFETEAAQMSSDQMQSLFGKILAGEIRKPKSFSRRTLKIIAQLDNDAAQHFQTLCSLAVSLRIPETSHIVDARVVGMGSPGSNSLAGYGLPFNTLNVLSEYGLIIAEYDSYLDYRVCIISNNQVRLPFHFQGKTWGFTPDPTKLPVPTEFRLDGVAFSKAGIEMLPIVDISPKPEYVTALLEFWKGRGMAVTPVVIP